MGKKIYQLFQVLFIFLALFLIHLLFIGCSGGAHITYEFDVPTPEKIEVTGIDTKDSIIEILDIYEKQVPPPGELYVVIGYNGTYKIATINATSGKITTIKPLATYDYEKTLYWDNLKEHDLSTGQKCLGACLSTTAFGGTTEKYGFNGEKKIFGRDTNKILISYQYVEVTRTYSGYFQDVTETKWESAGTQKIVEGENVIDIESGKGYLCAFNIKYAWRKARFYPVGNNLYLSLQPNSNEPTETVTFIILDTKEKKSWGADAKFPEPNIYVDGGVVNDGKQLFIVTGKPGKYQIYLYKNTAEIAHNVKTFKAVQD